MGDKIKIIAWLLMCGVAADVGYSAGNNVENESNDTPPWYMPFDGDYNSRTFRQVAGSRYGGNDPRGNGGYGNSRWQNGEPRTEGYNGLSNKRPGYLNGETKTEGYFDSINNGFHFSQDSKTESYMASNKKPSNQWGNNWNTISSSDRKPNGKDQKGFWTSDADKWSTNSQGSGKPIQSSSGTKPNQGNGMSWSFGQDTNTGSRPNKNQDNDKSSFWSSNQGSSSWNSDSTQNTKPNQWDSNSRPNNDDKKNSDQNYRPWNSGSNTNGNGRPNQGNNKPNSWSSGNTNGKPNQGSSNQGSWNDQGNKPNSWSSNKKPTQNQSGSKPGSNQNKPTNNKKEEVDWQTIEKTNKEGKLVLDLSSLWGTNKKPSGQRPKSTKRDATDGSLPQCYCTTLDDCGNGQSLNVMDVFKRGRYHLSAKVVECAISNMVCCMETSSHLGEITGDPDGLIEYGTKLGAFRSSCGTRKTKRTDEEINRDGIANYGDYPWILRVVRLNEDGGQDTLCSASLIHSSIALTTASCAMLLSGDSIRVRAGDWNLFSGHDRNTIQEIEIGKIFLHPEFDLVTYKNDLALVFLGQELDLGINSVCLPSQSDAWDISRCAIVGWTKDGQGTGQSQLRVIDLETIKQGKCRNRFGNRSGDLVDASAEEYICAHSSDGIPCITDPGASLTCPLYNTDTYVQVGLVSQPSACSRPTGTATFADVLESMDWISHMEGVYFLARNGLI